MLEFGNKVPMDFLNDCRENRSAENSSMLLFFNLGLKHSLGLEHRLMNFDVVRRERGRLVAYIKLILQTDILVGKIGFYFHVILCSIH